MTKSDVFKISVPFKGNETELEVSPLVEKDQVLYEIRSRNHGLFFVIGLNEEAMWEANTDIDETFVSLIGKAIDDFEAVQS